MKGTSYTTFLLYFLCFNTSAAQFVCVMRLQAVGVLTRGFTAVIAICMPPSFSSHHPDISTIIDPLSFIFRGFFFPFLFSKTGILRQLPVLPSLQLSSKHICGLMNGESFGRVSMITLMQHDALKISSNKTVQRSQIDEQLKNK